MVTHTLVFSFPDEMSEADRDQFFREGSALVLGSGLAESYEHKRHIPLVSGAATPASPVFAASRVARIRCASLDAMQELFAYPPLAEFVRRWQRRFPYKVVVANTED
jgi:hypothetical protein